MNLQNPWLAAISVTIGMLSGCGTSYFPGASESTPTGTVGVVDLDAVAQRLGSDKVIADSLARQTTSLKQELHQLAKSYHDQITQRQEAIAKNPAENHKVSLASYQEQANAHLSKARQQVQSEVVKFRAQLIQRFRDEIRPTVRRIADERGLSIVVTKNDSVIYDYGSAVDLTEPVVQSLLANSHDAQNQTATGSDAQRR